MNKIPNIVSFTRILLTPLIVLLVVNEMMGIALIIFIFAAATDMFDGLLARKFKVESKFGATLDELADKVLVVGVLIALMIYLYNHSIWGIFFLGVNSLLIVRHILMTGLRRYCSKRNISNAVKVMKVAKMKTFLEMVYLALFILHIDLYDQPYLINVFNSYVSYGFLFVLAVITLFLSYCSFIKYTKNVVSHLTISSSRG